MVPSAPLTVVSHDGDTSWEFRLLGSQEISLKRVIETDGERWGGESMGPRWSCAIVELQYGAIELYTSGSQRLLTPGRYFVVHPPFSCFRLSLIKGRLVAHNILSWRTFDFLAGKLPLFIETDKNRLPESMEGLYEAIISAYKQSALLHQPPVNVIAERTKFIIDNNFRDSTSLGEIAKLVNTSPAQMTRNFKEAYFFTPVQYRTHMRITNSLRELLYDRPISEVFQSAGYSDLSRFNKNFKKLLAACPSQFQFKRTNLSKNAKKY